MFAYPGTFIAFFVVAIPFQLILLAIGFGATNPKKLRGSKAFTIAFSVWAIYVVCRVGGAWIFS